MKEILMLVGIGWIVVGTIRFIAEIASALKTRANERQAVEDFCKKRNYCYYGCGGGWDHDDKNYYGGYNCGSDHK